MEIIWSNIITPGLTIVAFQTSFVQTFRMADRQTWCEPHKKMCQRFAFGVCSFFNESPQFLNEEAVPGFLA